MTRVYKYYTLVKRLYTQATSKGTGGGVDNKKAPYPPPGCYVRMGVPQKYFPILQQGVFQWIKNMT